MIASDERALSRRATSAAKRDTARARGGVCVFCSRECASGGGEEEDPDDDMLRLRVERQHLFSSAVDAVMRVPRAELRRGHTLEVRVTCRVK